MSGNPVVFTSYSNEALRALLKEVVIEVIKENQQSAPPKYITRSAVAKEFGVTPNTVAKYEKRYSFFERQDVRAKDIHYLFKDFERLRIMLNK